jgi:hypothetical protein
LRLHQCACCGATCSLRSMQFVLLAVTTCRDRSHQHFGMLQGRSVSAPEACRSAMSFAGQADFAMPTPVAAVSHLQQCWPLSTGNAARSEQAPQLTPDECINRLSSILLSPSAMHLSDLLQNMDTAPLDVHFEEPDMATATPGATLPLPSSGALTAPASHSISFPQMSQDVPSPSFGTAHQSTTPGTSVMQPGLSVAAAAYAGAATTATASAAGGCPSGSHLSLRGMPTTAASSPALTPKAGVSAEHAGSVQSGPLARISSLATRASGADPCCAT